MNISKMVLKIHRNNGGNVEVQNTLVVGTLLLTLRKLGLLSEFLCVDTVAFHILIKLFKCGADEVFCSIPQSRLHFHFL